MAEIVIDERLIEPGEPFFAMYVDLPNGVGRTVVAELEMELVGPVSADQLKPRRLSGFEFPAHEMIERAHRLAAEKGARKILLVDPKGLLTLARLGRKAGR